MATKTTPKTRFSGFAQYELQRTQLVDEIVTALYQHDPDATVRQVSERAQISMTTLRRLNTGRTLFPRLDTMWKMATAARMKIGLVK